MSFDLRASAHKDIPVVVLGPGKCANMRNHGLPYRQRLAVAAVCYLSAACVFAEGKSNMKVDEYLIALPRFEIVQREGADKAADGAIQAHYGAVANLIAQLRGAKTNDGKLYVIYLLGVLRAQAAVRDLVKIIDFKAERVDPKASIGRWGPYPAQEALSKIGLASVEPILQALGKEENDTRRKLMLMVLLDCYGKDVSRFVLEKAAHSAPAEAKAKYEKAISVMSAWK
jgi:HEAT repeat protein